MPSRPRPSARLGQPLWTGGGVLIPPAQCTAAGLGAFLGMLSVAKHPQEKPAGGERLAAGCGSVAGPAVAERAGLDRRRRARARGF